MLRCQAMSLSVCALKNIYFDIDIAVKDKSNSASSVLLLMICIITVVKMRLGESD